MSDGVAKVVPKLLYNRIGLESLDPTGKANGVTPLLEVTPSAKAFYYSPRGEATRSPTCARWNDALGQLRQLVQ